MKDSTMEYKDSMLQSDALRFLGGHEQLLYRLQVMLHLPARSQGGTLSKLCTC